MNNTAVLIFSCPDKKGIVASVSKVLFDSGANIIESNQHSAKSLTPHFFMRIVFELDADNNNADIDVSNNYDSEVYNADINVSNNNRANNCNNKNYSGNSKNLNKSIRAVKFKIDEIASEFDINFKISDISVKKNAAVFVSKEDHCLNELLWQKSAGDILLDIRCIISNHANLSAIANFYEIPFIYVPSNIDKDKQEEIILEKLKNFNIDFIILAKYMRILSENFINLFGKKIINIHHSFLPSFPGAKPYEQAYEKGVKIIGATAHFVNEKLDDGPIIEQDVIRINHEDNPDDLKRKGKIIERLVLAKAVKLFIEDRIIEYGNKTIVFD
jgi:formyltetrahydrofolate deformylase